MANLTINQAKFIELERIRKQYLEEFDAVLATVAEEVGVGGYFRDPSDGTIYKITTPKGRWVRFDTVSYERTRRADDPPTGGNFISQKEAAAVKDIVV